MAIDKTSKLYERLLRLLGNWVAPDVLEQEAEVLIGYIEDAFKEFGYIDAKACLEVSRLIQQQAALLLSMTEQATALKQADWASIEKELQANSKPAES